MNNGEKPCYSKQKTVWIKTKRQPETYLSPKVLTQQTIKMRYPKIGKVVATKEEVTQMESIMLSSPRGFFDQKSSDVFSYNQTPLKNYTPNITVDALTRRKSNQV